MPGAAPEGVSSTLALTPQGLGFLIWNYRGFFQSFFHYFLVESIA